MKQTVSALVLLGLMGCGWSVDVAGRKVAGSDDGGNESQEYKYKLEENGCSTGSQVFDSKEEMCKGLLDEPRNNGCARRLREEYHRQNCQ